MKSHKKTTQHNTTPKKISRKQKRKEIDSEMSIYSCDQAYWPVSKERLLTYGNDLLLMIDENPRMFNLQPWFKKHKLTRNQVEHYLHRYPKFKEIWKEAKQQIGWRILERGLNKQADANLTKFILPLYADVFRDLEEWRSFMKQQVVVSDKPTITVVEVPSFRPSGLVPEKVIDKASLLKEEEGEETT